MSLIAAHDRERRFELGYERKGQLRGQLSREIRAPMFFRTPLGHLGYHACSLKTSPPHECKGRIVVDHDHCCAVGHAANNACPQCIRGLLCHWGNLCMAVWDAEYRARGDLYLPPEIVDYMAARPLA